MMYTFFSHFKIDLSVVNVTCKGASSPIEMLFNLIIMGLCIIVIESNFQLFRAITFNATTDAFIKGLTQPAYKGWAYRNRGTSALKTFRGVIRYFGTLFLVIFVRAAGGFDFFQAFMQFLMTFMVSYSPCSDSCFVLSRQHTLCPLHPLTLCFHFAQTHTSLMAEH